VEGSSFRPDFAIRKDEKTVAYIEVELGDRDKDQEEQYAAELKEPTLWIVGPDDNTDGDLSLEKIKAIAEEVAKSAEAQAKTKADSSSQRIIE